MKPLKLSGRRKNAKNVPAEVEKDEFFEVTKHHYPIVLPPNEPIEGITFGLELLTGASHIFVRPAQEPIAEGHSLGEHDQYEIIDSANGRIYYAWESDVHGEGRNRTYVLKIVDYDARPVFQVRRIAGCLSCCLQAFNCFGTTGSLIEIESPDGERIGALVQRYNGWRPKFVVLNSFEKPSMTVVGPSGGDCCYGCNITDASFDVLDSKGKRIASIHSGSGDPMAEQNHESFGIHFFTNFPVEEKAIMVGTVFALNFKYFSSHTKPQRRSHMLDDMEKSRKQTHQRDMDELGMKSIKSSQSTLTVETKSTIMEEPIASGDRNRRGSLIDDANLHLVNRKKFSLR